MSKAVLMSIRPNWCKLIWSGMKTVEIRKTRPKLKPPFKVYIYCTENESWEVIFRQTGRQQMNGKVIGEFACDDVRRIGPEYCIIKEDIESAITGSCLTVQQVRNYASWKSGLSYVDLKDLYSWHISNLKIYDKPRNLHEFCRFDFQSMNGTNICGNTKCENYIPSNSWMQPPDCAIDGCHLKYPPQSWCYIEGLPNGKEEET